MKLLISLIVCICILIVLALTGFRAPSKEMTGWTTIRPNWHNTQKHKHMIRDGWQPDGYCVLGDSLILMWKKPKKPV